METKTEQAIALFEAKEYKKAYRIFKTFRHTFNSKEMRDIEIAYECFTGKEAFYLWDLGLNTHAIKCGAKFAVMRFIDKRKQSITL